MVLVALESFSYLFFVCAPDTSNCCASSKEEGKNRAESGRALRGRVLIALMAVVLSPVTHPPSEVADSLLSLIEELGKAVPGRLPLLPLPTSFITKPSQKAN